MAVAPLKASASSSYGPSLGVARAPSSVRDAVASRASQIAELQGAHLAGTRAEASTPDNFEGFGPLARRPVVSTPPLQIPRFSIVGLAPMAYFAQERTDSASSSSANAASRGLGPHAAGKGAAVYESAKRSIDGAPQASYRFS
ncbi:MAG: hypothetical protein HQL43_15850 [Alphaproteobacteria bacterium]|nr:hypothetical protein [Alphaproteobacteria bacterium]